MKRLLATILLLVVPPACYAQEKTKFIDIETTHGQITALKTATVGYKKGDVTLDLIAVVHVGDREYYRKLNRQFVQYDALLYELVAPKGPAPKKENGLYGWVIRYALDLESQKDRIDYQRKNFVHADLSFKEMGERLAKRGDTTVTFAMRAIADLMREANLQAKKPVNPLEAIELVNGVLGMKRIMAQKLITSGLPTSITEVLINDRNDAAMEVLATQLAAGKKKMGLFYGAAHMPDFEQRLLKLGWTKTKSSWLTAWDLSDD